MKYYVGDFIEFKAGGFGMIIEVSQNGWGRSYATSNVLGFPRNRKKAWHWDYDIERIVSPSPTRQIKAINHD